MVKKLVIAGLIVCLLLLSISAASATWWDTDWSHRKQWTVTNVNATAFTNYGAYINVTDEAEMQADWDDVVFTDSNSNKIAYELENYTTGFGDYWVNISSLPGDGTYTGWIYYGNDVAVSQENPEGVWNVNVSMAQHMNDLNDSTSYNNDATNHGATYTSSGMIDGAYDFDGSSDYVNCGNDPSLNITDAITIEAWVKPISSGEAGHGRIMWKTDAITVFMNRAGSQDIKVLMRVGGVDKTASSTGDAVSYNNWHHVVGVFDGINVLVYVDGIMFTGSATAGPIDDPSASNMHIGNRHGASRTFDGSIDEVKIYNRVLSANEIKQSYQLASNQSSYVVWGSAEDQYIPPTPTDLVNVTGNFWINHTWSPGSGYVTDSYNVSVNGTWYNTTNTYHNNTPLYGHAWSNISVWAFNSSGDGSLSVSSISQNTQIPNNPVTVTNTSNFNGEVGELVYLDFDFTPDPDLDGDSVTFSTNATEGGFDTSTGIFIWNTSLSDIGTYYWLFSVTDGYDTSSYLSTIIVGEFSINVSVGSTYINWNWSYPGSEEYEIWIDGRFRNNNTMGHIIISGLNPREKHEISVFKNGILLVTDTQQTFYSHSLFYFIFILSMILLVGTLLLKNEILVMLFGTITFIVSFLGFYLSFPYNFAVFTYLCLAIGITALLWVLMAIFSSLTQQADIMDF